MRPHLSSRARPLTKQARGAGGQGGRAAGVRGPLDSVPPQESVRVRGPGLFPRQPCRAGSGFTAPQAPNPTPPPPTPPPPVSRGHRFRARTRGKFRLRLVFLSPDATHPCPRRPTRSRPPCSRGLGAGRGLERRCHPLAPPEPVSSSQPGG